MNYISQTHILNDLSSTFVSFCDKFLFRDTSHVSLDFFLIGPVCLPNVECVLEFQLAIDPIMTAIKAD